MNDHSFNTESFGPIIQNTEQDVGNMEEIFDQMKKMVSDILLQNGLSGEVAKILMETYEREVLQNFRNSVNNIRHFNSLNQKTLDSAKELEERTKKIASF